MNDIIFAGKLYRTYRVHRHQHKTWELVYCTGEKGKFIFDGLELAYSQGDIVVIPPDIPHANVGEGGFTNIYLNMVETTFSFSQPTLVSDDGNHSILHLFSDAYYLYSGDSKHRAALLSGYGDLIARYINVYQEAHPRNPAVDKLERSIRQNFGNANYVLDELLRSLPYCPDYLCRIFRKEVGMTPHKYLINLRLQAAADMLCSDFAEGGITEVACTCGFRNPLYFSRMFKQKYGVSPKEYYHQRLRSLSAAGEERTVTLSAEGDRPPYST